MKKNKVSYLGGVVLIIVVLVLIYFALVSKQNDMGSDKFIIGEGEQSIELQKLKNNQVPQERRDVHSLALETIKEKPYDRTSLLNIGYTYKIIGETNEAEKVFSYYLDKDPLDPEVLLGLARVKVDQKQYEVAEDTYYRILQPYPTYATAYRELLVLYGNKTLEPNRQFIEDINRGIAIADDDIDIEKLKEFLHEYNLIPK